MQIQILTAKVVAHPTKTPGKTTPKLDLAYKNLTFQGKVEGKQLFSFGGNKGSYDVLSKASADEVYEITVVKNDAGYNDWTNAVKANAGAPTPAAAGGSIGGAKPAGGAYTPNAAKSTYETPEERAKKQVYIVRQSSIGSAIDLLTTGAKAAPDVKLVLDTAKQFEEYVFGGSDEAVTAPDPKDKDTFGDLDGLDDVPL